MCHCRTFSSQASHLWCKTRARAHFRKTFSISALCLTGWNRPCTYCCTFQSSSQPSLLRMRTVSSPGMHREYRISHVHSLPDRRTASSCLRVRQMQNHCLSSAGIAAQHGRSRSGVRRTPSRPSGLGEQGAGAKLSHPHVPSELGGWREAISPVEPRRKLTRLFVAQGLEEGAAPESGSASHLSPSGWL